MGKKDKKSLDESQTEDANEPSYEDRLQYVSVIAEPMASKKLAKKVCTKLFTSIYPLWYVIVLFAALQMHQKGNEAQIVREKRP